MEQGNKNRYALVFIHGMFGWGESVGLNKYIPYWGATTGDLTKFLENEGYNCYSASSGPMSSAWDRACELYAQFTGTRVDYGKAHSEKYGHKQFGRAYEKPVFENWSAENKLHLIGHSFGGNAARMLCHLLTYGAPEEIEASGEAVSPLFLGGKGDYICSVTAISSPLSGTNAHDVVTKFKAAGFMKKACSLYSGILGRTRLNGKLVDFQLEQFGLSNTPGQKDAEPLLKSIDNFCESKDQVEYDMSPEGSQAMNNYIKISPEVFYFSYPFNSVKQYRDGKTLLPTDTNFPFLAFTSALMTGNTKLKKDEVDIIQALYNDGLVDLASASHPSTEPFSLVEEVGAIKAGVWNVMPVTQGDHGMAIGLFENKEKTQNFYNQHISLLKSIENRCEEAAKEK